MRVVVLGTSSGVPTPSRTVSGVAVVHGRAWDLYDCGDGTQQQLQRARLSLARLRRVFISHLHGDHVFGLFGVLASRAMVSGAGPLQVFGPVGLRRLVDTVFEISDSHLGFDLTITEMPETGGPTVEGGPTAIPLDHRVTSFAWHSVLPDTPGKLDLNRLRSLGVPEGPMWGALQRGETVELADGQAVESAAVVGPPQPGASFAIAGDNRDPAALLARTGPLDLLMHEATFTEADIARLGGDRGHSSAARVAAAARDAAVRELVLTHFSPRHHGDLREIEQEAIEGFGRAPHFASDLDVYELTMHDGSLVLQRRE